MEAGAGDKARKVGKNTYGSCNLETDSIIRGLVNVKNTILNSVTHVEDQ